MTAIVTYAHRYKRPPRKKKPVAIEVPEIVTVADKKQRRASRRDENGAGSVPIPEADPKTQARGFWSSAIVTARRPGRARIPGGLLPDTPEEHRRRGNAADALFRDAVHRTEARTKQQRSSAGATKKTGAATAKAHP